MSFAHFSESGFEANCDSGIASLQDDCPCGCPPFEGRSVIYVDKHAAVTGDGSSWENAYTDIQTAVNAHPRKEIQIKGYGESDCYPSGISLPVCSYLYGVDTGSGEVWIDGISTSVSEYGITGFVDPGNRATSNLIENVNIKNSSYGFQWVYELKNCNIKNTNWGFAFCANIENCNANNSGTGFDFQQSCNCINCNTYDCGFGFSQIHGAAILTKCTSNRNIYTGFWIASSFGDNILTECISTGSHNYIYGAVYMGAFSCANTTLIDCVAYDNDYCGFRSTNSPISTPNTYINCSEYNNCLSGYDNCTPGYPNYYCDEV